MTQLLLDPGAALAIAEGRHGAPFDVLGPHPRGKDWIVTAYAPGATKLQLLTSVKTKTPLEATPVPGFDGFFQAVLPKRVPYRLRASNDVTEWEYDDAYRFGPVLGEMDEYLLGEGTHRRMWQVLGAHLMTHEGTAGVHFAVWAPHAQRVSVVGDFNLWDGRRHPMRLRGATGVWEIFVPDLKEGNSYKYEIRMQNGVILPLKADPVGFGSEHPPANASVVRDISPREWADVDWMETRESKQNIEAPISIYEVHLGSWKRVPGNRMLSYLELAEQLVGYVADMGFTHIEVLPVSEYPFDGSWGYQPVGMFAPTIRHGTPQEFRALVEAAHLKGIGVLIDWVPGHFPSDAHGLGYFDGTALYEHEDPRQGFHPDWNTLIYNYGRIEVSNYLISNALYWLEEYHVDGMRVDAVASMLYRDFSREAGQWIPNKDGGRENYEVIAALQRTNTICYGQVPGIMTVAEESSTFPGVTRPVSSGGLGFGFKWNMGWMNDTLSYMKKDPLFRKFNHHQMTFASSYAWSENFVLPISHDEVVHGKGSMLGKMPGTSDEKFANLRAFYGFMWAHPGKKLLFMGQEFAQGAEWNHKQSLDWHQLDIPAHAGVQTLVRDLNRVLRDNPALYFNDSRYDGFQWIDANNAEGSTYAWLRKGKHDDPMIAVVCNMTPVERRLRLGLPDGGSWTEILNTDSAIYGGGNRGNMGMLKVESEAWNGMPQSAMVTLPPLSTIYFRHD